VGAHPWQAPSDGSTVEIWMANEADARTEAWWRLGCLSGDTQELWVVGIKEVWGASERSTRSWYWPIRAPLPDYCVEQGSITIVDENGNELQYLAESTDLDPQVFYVKQEPPQLLTGGTYTGPIQGVLKSFYYEGDVLDSLTIDLVYGNYGGESYHRAGPFEAVYVGGLPGDTPSVPTATAIYAMRGAPIVADPQGVGSNAVPNFVAVVIHSISFNWDDTGSLQDAMTVHENPAGNPEWPPPSGQIYKDATQAAYFGGITPIIKASISVIPPDKTVRIHPVSAKCGNYSMMPTCFPMLPKQTVTATADYEFEFSAPLPEGITYITDHLWWKIVLQSDVEIATFPNVTGPHDMYVIDRPPVDSMEEPWVEVLRYSSFLLSKDYYSSMTDDEILYSLAEGLWSSKWKDDSLFKHKHVVQYNSNPQPWYVEGYSYFTSYKFKPKSFLSDLNNNWTVNADCFTVVGFYKSLADSLGVNVGALGVKAQSGDLKTSKILAIGGFDIYESATWDYHMTTTYPKDDQYGIIYELTFAFYPNNVQINMFGVGRTYYKEHSFILPPWFIDLTPVPMGISE